MKILHICLAAHYTEGMAYQDNQLPDQNAKDGHEVVVVSDCFKYDGSRLIEVQEEDKVLPSGVRLIRLQYDRVINKYISSKVRKVKKLKCIISNEKPQVIVFHGVAGWEMLTSAKYKENHANVKLYIDSHEDFHNSGRFWVSRLIQYRLFNRLIVNRIKRNVDKFLYITYESKNFLSHMYGLREDEMEFYPLGGFIVDRYVKTQCASSIRARHNFLDSDILIIHTGKLDEPKKTRELILAFMKVESQRLKLLIIGSIPKEREQILFPLIERDKRILFLGWKRGEELREYLAGADLYFQPGTQSATMQNAVCSGTPVALYPYPSHTFYQQDNVFYVKDIADYIGVFERILQDDTLLPKMSEASYKIAFEQLDYKVLAARLYV